MQKGKVMALMMTAILAGNSLRAEEWVNETFEGQSLTTVQKQGDKRKVQWIVKEQGTLNVVDDSKGLASGKALQSKQILGVIPTVLLTNSGDTITIQFDFRMAGPVQASKGYSPRFGLYYVDAADPKDPWSAGSGSGYYAGLTAGGTASGVELKKESGITGKIMQGDDNTLLGLGTTEYWINDTKKHTAKMTMTMMDAGLNISVQLDGISMVQATDMFALQDLTLNRFALLSKTNELFFDNFKVDVQMAGTNQFKQ